ncbi:MAG: hypothetical protein JRI68_10065 [Deltaproteobacteria bacterium]|nr:hypothetical protein [Deltaproteobacteria bacterium]
MNRWIALAALGLLSPACLIPGSGEESDDQRTTSSSGDATDPLCVVAATAGGDGGPGGLLAVTSTKGMALDGVVESSGGEAGEAGEASLGPVAPPGGSGAAGTIELVQDTALSFDTSLVSAGAVITVGVENESDVITVGGTGANPTIAVERLELGPGATLAISRYSTIIAQHLIIAPGARLVLRDGGEPLVSVGEGGTLDGPSLSGGTVTIIAQNVAIEGTLDASGSDGAEGSPGGMGGQLHIRTESLSLPSTGAISVTGGNGGPGIDEGDCND